MKKGFYLKTLSAAAVLLIPLALQGCTPPKTFDTFCDEFMADYLSGDYYATNLFFTNPADYGIEESEEEAKWYTYSEKMDAEYQKEMKDAYQEIQNELHTFNYDELTSLQKATYNQLDDMFSYNVKYYSIEDIEYMHMHYIDQFGGYVANLASSAESYKFRNEKDVQNLLSMIKSTEEAFTSYLDFAQDKLDKGYPYNDYTLTEMMGFLDDLEEQGEDYYLYDYINNKIDATDFLDDAKKESYKTSYADALTNDFMVGVAALNDGLEQFKGKCPADKAGYWASYEQGKELFKMNLEDLLGFENMDMEAYIDELDAELERTIKLETQVLNTIMRTYKITSQAALDLFLENNCIYDGTPEEMLEYLKEFAKTIVPELKTTPEITIKEMDEASAKVSNAVAYYTKSPIDDFSHEYITLNPIKLDDINDTLGTMAHEGYPGHLYAYVFAKESDIHNISKIMGNVAHAEGWATYVETKLYDYALGKAANAKEKNAIKYLDALHNSGFLIETRIDAGIHYQRWTVTDVAKYLGDLGYNSGAAQEIYDLLIEMPSQYAAYGYGKYYFVKLHEEAKKALGSSYNEIEYNAALLSKGWTGLGELKNTSDEFIASKKQ